MSTSITAESSSGAYNTPAFWERFWRLSGLQFVALFIVAWVIYGYQPGVGASGDTLAEFYDGHRTRILLAAVISAINLLNLLWFTAALRTTLADAGLDGWGAAATAASAAFGALYLLHIAVGATLAFSIAGAGNLALASGLNDLAWALDVLISLPRAMLIMSGVFGLWRAGLISNTLFTVGVTAVVLGVLGSTTWLSGGVWAPDGTYTRFVSPVLLLLWVMVVSRVLLTQSPATRAGW